MTTPVSNPTATAAAPANSDIHTKLKEGIKKAILKGEFDIPSLPHVSMEVMKLMNNPNVGLAQLEQLIKQDQAMTARIIKTANSVMFRGAMEITSLQQAMARIGLKNVKDVVISLGLQSDSFKVPGYEEIIKITWEGSVGAALISQSISKSLLRDQESSFLAGLLSSIGRAVIIQIVAKLEKNEMILARNAAFSQKVKFDEKTFRVPGLREEVLPKAFEEYQSVVGAAVAAKWNLPQLIGDVIKFGRDPEKAPDSSKNLCQVISLAISICKHCGFGGLAEAQNLGELPSAKALNLGADELNEIVQDAQDKVGAQLAVFLN